MSGEPALYGEFPVCGQSDQVCLNYDLPYDGTQLSNEALHPLNNWHHDSASMSSRPLTGFQNAGTAQQKISVEAANK